MRRYRLAAMLTMALLLGSLPALGVAETVEPQVLTGAIGAADYRIEVPSNWNGTLLLFNHGTVRPGAANPAVDAPEGTAPWLLDHGYALAGSSGSTTGYALADTFQDDIALLDFFAAEVGTPRRTIVWGGSQGGMVAAGLAQKFPERFDGALPMSGFLAGAVGQENIHLDSAFALKTLVAPGSDLPLVNIADGDAALAQATQLVQDAHATLQGRARLALAAAVGNVPGWFDPASSPPAKDDFDTQEESQFHWFQSPHLDFYFYHRAEIEGRAGGNFSWNTGVDYSQQLERSINRDEVYALYQRAGLSLADDLQTLARAPRISADPAAVAYLVDNVVFDGDLQIPVLTLHTMGDGRRVVSQDQAYGAVVHAAGRDDMLRMEFINRAGHANYTPAERISALMALERRLDTGHWEGTEAASLNAVAAALGPEANVLGSAPTAAAFANGAPAPFLRPFDMRCVDDAAAVPIPGELGPRCL